MAPTRASAPEAATPSIDGHPRYAAYVGERGEASWWNYIRELDGVGRLVKIGGVHVDGESMFRRRFECDTTTCAPGFKPGKKKERWRQSGQKSCCAELTVDLTRRELKRLEEHWVPIRRALARKAKFFAHKQVSDFVELGDDYEISLKKRGGRCVFAIKDAEWGIRCGIHAACLEEGIPVHEAKPVTCDTFPLIVIDLAPGTFYLGAYDKDVDGLASLSDDDVDPFPCLLNPRKGKRMYEAMGDTIRLYFGDAFYRELEAAAERYLAGPKPAKLVPPHER